MPNILMSVITIFLLLVLSLFVLFEDYHNKTYQSFCFLCSSIILWILSNMLADIFNEYYLVQFFIRSAIVGPALVPIFLNDLISKLYYNSDIKYKKQLKIVRYSSIVVFLIIIIFNQTILNTTNISKNLSGIEFEPGKL